MTHLAPTARILVPFAAVVLVGLVSMPRSAVAASATVCLTGSDPAVAADAGQIAALEASIEDTCPCISFDGS